MRTLFKPSFALNSLKISLVVGTLLNVINQGPALWGGANLSWIHLGLNFLVPFSVAYFSAWKNDRPTD